jgi:hypothetical protein
MLPDRSQLLLQPLADKIASSNVDLLARQTGFVRRTPKKVTPAGFLLTACLFALQTCGSLAAFAQLWAMLHQQTLSKQAVHKRCSAAAVAFLQAVLQSILGSSITLPGLPCPLSGVFRRILIQDSTNLALPKKLVALFPGPSNQQSQNQSSLKIQATLDLLQNQWIRFHLSPFTCNDQSASPQILEGLQKNDLVIRDLGYLVLDVLKQIRQCGAYFLSRWRYGIQVFCAESSEKADLLKLFGTSALWEGTVLLGKEMLSARLIAVRLPETVAAERRRKARSNRDRRLNHSDEYFQLLGWNIFITNVPQELLAAGALIKLYELRWRIEIIFKAWKTHFNIDWITNASAEQVLMIIVAKLIWITWFCVQFTQLVSQKINVSLLRLADWWSKFAPVIFQTNQLTPETLRKLIVYYCRYDKRKKRPNFLEKCACLG